MKELQDEMAINHLHALRPLEEQAHDEYMVALGEGRDSIFHTAFLVQVATESACGQCQTIGRSFEQLHYLDLVPSAEATSKSLQDLLAQWQRLECTAEHAVKCASGLADHHGSTLSLKRITNAPSYLRVRFAQTFGRSAVEIPEFLDISPYADNAHMHVDSNTRLVPDSIYRLVAVNMHHGGGIGESSDGHFVLYTLQNGIWVCFDDNSPDLYATAQHPQHAYNQGGIAYFVVYERMDGKTSLPNGGQSNGFLLQTSSTPGGAQPHVPKAKSSEPQWDVSGTHTKSSEGLAAELEAERAQCLLTIESAQATDEQAQATIKQARATRKQAQAAIEQARERMKEIDRRLGRESNKMGEQYREVQYIDLVDSP